MKNSAAIQPPLQLVGRAHEPWDDATDHAARTPHLLQPYDPRWVFAVRAAEEITRTGHAVILDQRREQLIRHAGAMGLSRFDALSIITIVAGEAAAGRHPLGADTEFRLTHLASTPGDCSRGSCGIPVSVAVIVTALVMGVFAYIALTI